ncbi:hypothetical protein V6N13_130076 [Hibiscus sabdariffa]
MKKTRVETDGNEAVGNEAVGNEVDGNETDGNEATNVDSAYENEADLVVLCSGKETEYLAHIQTGNDLCKFTTV